MRSSLWLLALMVITVGSLPAGAQGPRAAQPPAAQSATAAPQSDAPRASRPVRSDQETLMDLEREWNAAFNRNDARTIERILADEFIATYSDGTRGDKAKELDLATHFNQQIDSSELDDFVVRIYDKTAVVLFSLHLTGPQNGRPLSITYRYVDVFVFRDGRWQCVSSQSTQVPAARPK